MGQIKNGIIHAHTSNSVKDSTLSPSELVKRASELGAPAVVLSDHGVLTGVYEFMRAAKTTGIKGIPCMNIAILQECFGPGTTGYGHVISTSACVGGVLSRVLMSDRDLERDLETLREKQKSYHNPKDPEYLQMKRSLNDIGLDIDGLCEQRDGLKKLADRKFAAKERALSNLSGDALAEAQQKLTEEKAETERAAMFLATIKTTIVTKRKAETALRQQCVALEKSHPQWYESNTVLNLANFSWTYRGIKFRFFRTPTRI